MMQTTFMPQPLPVNAGPLLRPASPKLPQARPIVRHQTLPYGVPAVPKRATELPCAQISEERQIKFSASPTAAPSLSQTQRFVAVTHLDEEEHPDTVVSVNAAAISEPAPRASRLRELLPISIAAGVGFLAACLLF